jgi:hypothetical protein
MDLSPLPVNLAKQLFAVCYAKGSVLMRLMQTGVSHTSQGVAMPAAQSLPVFITTLYRRAYLALAVLIIAGISFLAPCPGWQQLRLESRCQLALPVDRGFDPFGSASEQMCSAASTRRHLHIFWDIQRSQHKGKNIFIRLGVLVFERIIQVVITGPVRTAY